MKSLLPLIGFVIFTGCASYNYSGAVIRPGGWGGGGWGHYGGGWGHTNVAVVNERGLGGGYYHPGRW